MQERTCTTAAFGWSIYGLGAKAVSGIVFLIGPLILIDAARKAEELAAANDEGEDEDLGLGLPHLRATSLPSLTITIALFAQCVAAPFLASLADMRGIRRQLMAGHVAAGLFSTILLGISSPTTPVFYQAFLVGTIYYTMAIAWMFQNSLLPSVAPVHRRPGLSLASTALSNLGGAAFLIVQHRLLSAGSGGGSASPPMPLARIASSTSPVESSNPAIVPVASATSAVVAAAAAHAPDWHAPPSSDALHLVVLLGAAWWLVSAVPALLCMATLPAEPPPPPEHLSPTDTATLDLVDAPEHSGVSFFAGLRRMRKHKHASRFVLSQVLYLTASTADGTSASAFAQEVVGLDVAAIVRLTMYAAFAGAAGSIATMGLARCFGARATLCCLMTLPPLLLVYSSCILVSETEFLVVGMIHAFVSGGVGFHGLNRGVFSQMVPKGREAEFFGVYFVSIKACSWMGPLVQAMLNELTGSLRLAVLSALAFYVPAVVCLGMTDFEEAKREAETGGATQRTRSQVAGKGDPGGSMNASALAAPSAASASSSADGPREKLLGATSSPASYGTC